MKIECGSGNSSEHKDNDDSDENAELDWSQPVQSEGALDILGKHLQLFPQVPPLYLPELVDV